MGCIGSPATATTRPPRNGPIHRQVRAPNKPDCAVVGVVMVWAASFLALVLLLGPTLSWIAEQSGMLPRLALIYTDVSHAGVCTRRARRPADSHRRMAIRPLLRQSIGPWNQNGVAASGIAGPEDYNHAWAVVLDALKCTY